MPYRELQALIHRMYAPAIALRAWMAPEKRTRMRVLFVAITLVLLLGVLLAFGLEQSPSLNLIALHAIVDGLASRILGLFFIFFSVTFILFALEAMHNSYYFHGLESVLQERSEREQGTAVSWGVATIVADTADEDITEGFIMSELGQQVLFRVGVTEEAFDTFVTTRVSKLNAPMFLLERDTGVTLPVYAVSIYKQDEEFRNFLSTHAVNKDDFVRSAEWVVQIDRAQRQKTRWWSRDNLGRIPGLGKTWSYGETYLLERYGHDLKNDPMWDTTAFRVREEDDEVEVMETTLVRTRQSNVIIVSEDPMTARESVIALYRKILKGTVLPPLEGRRIFLLDIETIVTAYSDKSSFESAVRETLNQAVTAGNVILYFENLPVAIASARSFDVDLIDILLPYFEANTIQIIIGSDTESFHHSLECDARVMRECDVVKTHAVNERALRELLAQRALRAESYTGIVCTIPALDTILRVADRYFPGGVMPDKAYDLLEEVIPFAQAQQVAQVLPDLVTRLVAQKTGVPVGAPSKEESEKLLSLEDTLHASVVGQDSAINAVAKALRRARAGTTNPNKPMGSFLFLGPTGVGKTETAKALARTLFRNEGALNRLDMSEFQSPSAVEELIGSFETGVPGRLATMMRDNQYGVLLLDELEKSAHGVHDLLLQILDEGMFSDGRGTRVNVRNQIIIATSNAGAELIWEWSRDGIDIVAQKRNLIDHLIKHGLYRPELLNRFDDIVVFHPLAVEHMREIARIHLMRLADRLKREKNIQLEVTEALIQSVAQKGYDPQFGGRALARTIQEEVEQIVADSILKDTLRAGGTLTYKV